MQILISFEVCSLIGFPHIAQVGFGCIGLRSNFKSVLRLEDIITNIMKFVVYFLAA